MGKFKRIDMKDIKTMQKILDDLPDKNLGKTREEAMQLLNANMHKALEKGYSVKELSEIMSEGSVSIPAHMLRKKLLPSDSTPKKAKSPSKGKPIKETRVNVPLEQKQDHELPAYYTPDKPDTEL